MAVTPGRSLDGTCDKRHSMSLRLRLEHYQMLETMSDELRLSNSAVIHDAIEFYFKALHRTNMIS